MLQSPDLRGDSTECAGKRLHRTFWVGENKEGVQKNMARNAPLILNCARGRKGRSLDERRCSILRRKGAKKEAKTRMLNSTVSGVGE